MHGMRFCLLSTLLPLLVNAQSAVSDDKTVDTAAAGTSASPSDPSPSSDQDASPDAKDAAAIIVGALGEVLNTNKTSSARSTASSTTGAAQEASTGSGDDLIPSGGHTAQNTGSPETISSTASSRSFDTGSTLDPGVAGLVSVFSGAAASDAISSTNTDTTTPVVSERSSTEGGFASSETLLPANITTSNNDAAISSPTTSTSIAIDALPSAGTTLSGNSERVSATTSVQNVGPEPASTGQEATSPPTNTVAESSSTTSEVVVLETQLGDLFPVILGWTDDNTQDIQPVKQQLDDVKETINKNLDTVEPQDTSGGCASNLFAVFTCIGDSVTSITGSISGTVSGTLVQTVKSQVDELQNLKTDLEKLKQNDNNDQAEDNEDDGEDDSEEEDEQSSTMNSQTSTTSQTSVSSQTSSCSQGSTISAVFTTCSPSAITTEGTTTTTHICDESTSTVSGCSISATGSATTLSASSTEALCGDACGGCIAQATGASVSKRQARSRNPTLAKRTLDDPNQYPGSYNQYMVDYANGDHQVEFVPMHVGEYGPEGNLPTAKWTKLENERYNLMLKGLWGCTSMVVVSRLGVYMNHLWENPSFVDVERFESDVKNMVSSGDSGRDDMPGLASLMTGDGQPFAREGAEKWAGLMDGNKVQTFLVTPRYPDRMGNVLRYPDEVRYLESYLSVLVPNVKPKVVPYTPRHPRTFDYTTSARGKLLFQYDPAHDTKRKRYTVRGKTVECPVQMSALRLYANDDPTPLYEDRWQNPHGSFGQANGRRALDAREESSVPAECQSITATASGDISATSDLTTTSVTSASPSTPESAQSSVNEEDHTTSSTESTTSPASAESVENTNTSTVSTSSTAPSSPLVPTVPAETTGSTGVPTTLSTVSSSSSRLAVPTETAASSSSQSPSSTSTPTLTSCAMETHPATVFEGQTLDESIYCSCFGGVQAGIQTTVDDDGYTSYTCVTGSTTFVVSTEAPPITSCSVSTAAAATINGQDLPETEMCDCNGAWQAGVSTTVGPDSTTSWICAVESTTIVASTQAPPPPPPPPAYQTGTCNVHILEVANSGSEPVLLQLNLTDGGGELLASREKEIEWTETFGISKEVSELPWNVEVTIPDSRSSKKHRRAALAPAPVPVDQYQSWPIELTAGDSSWSSEDEDLESLPHCEVGNWDNGGFANFIDEALSFGTMGQVPTRQMDCRFEC